MAALPALAERNTVLRSLPAADLGATLALLEARRVRLGAVLTSPGEPIAELVFPADAVASMVVDSEDGMSVEVATIGNDGLVGSECFLGLANASHRVIWQVEGWALVGRAVDLVGSDPDSNLARLSRRYFRTVLSQASQGVLCNRLHPLEQRAARWLLTVRDRVDSSTFRLTHEFFATMLGTHRPSVSLAAGILQEAGLIRYTRGTVEIINREELASASCPCYEVVARDYAATMAVTAPQPSPCNARHPHRRAAGGTVTPTRAGRHRLGGSDVRGPR